MEWPRGDRTARPRRATNHHPVWDRAQACDRRVASASPPRHRRVAAASPPRHRRVAAAWPQAEPSALWHTQLESAPRIYHYTFGLEYTSDGIPVQSIGDWSLDKRHYMSAYPPKELVTVMLRPCNGHVTAM